MRRRTSKPPSIGAFDAALGLLARRAHSEFEMRRKLGRRGYDRGEVDAAVSRLLARRLLDDSEFAAGHVRRRSRSLGPLAISAELAARGVDRDIADGALGGFDPQEQLESALRVAERLCGGKSYASYRELLNAVGSKLLRRGFSMTAARTACQAIWEATGAGLRA